MVLFFSFAGVVQARPEVELLYHDICLLVHRCS